MFKFHAKQGQENQVCRLLFSHLGTKPRVRKTDSGVLIVVNLPQSISKRSVDRLLFAHNVPGSVSRRNRFPVVSGEEFEVKYHPKVENGDKFIWVYKGKFQGKFRRVYVSFGCNCCGGHFELEQVTPA